MIRTRAMKNKEEWEMKETKSFYKVIVLKIDVFESVIVDERHFPDMREAAVFMDNIMSTTGFTAFAVKM